MRARNLKPGYFQNEELAECTPFARLLFAGLWCIADRAGRLEDRPKRIKAQVFPYDKLDTDALLTELVQRGFITRYEADGARYIAVLNFDKHQHPHVKEAPSTIPAPDEHDTSTVQEQKSPGGFPITDSLITDTPFSDTGETNPTHAREEVATAVAVVESPFAMVEGFIEELDSPDPASKAWKSKQYAVAKRLIADGIGVEQVRRCTRFMLSESWRTSPFDLFDIEKTIGKWQARGSPEHAGDLKQQRRAHVTDLSPAAQAIETVYLADILEDEHGRTSLPGQDAHSPSLSTNTRRDAPRMVAANAVVPRGIAAGED